MKTHMSQELFVTKFYVNSILENFKKRKNLVSVSKIFRLTIGKCELNNKKKISDTQEKVATNLAPID